MAVTLKLCYTEPDPSTSQLSRSSLESNCMRLEGELIWWSGFDEIDTVLVLVLYIRTI